MLLGEKMEKIVFTPEIGEEAIEAYVLEKTTLGGIDYLLVTDKEEGDAQAFILRDVTKEQGDDSEYVIVSDDAELNAVASVFENLLDDIEFVPDDEA